MSTQGAEGRGRTPRSSRGSVRFGLLVSIALAGLLLFAASASATFHLMKIREVYPAGNASYVVMQLLATGEFQVGGHHFVTYNANGTVADDFTLPNNVSPTSRNNSAVLITGPGYTAAFPSGPSTNEFNPNMNLSASGGAVCWVEGEPPDCVAWGNFTGPLPGHTPAFAVGSPASPSGVTAGKALRRSITAGCATILEDSDDSDDSATDFSEQTPNPRNNASAVPEKDCELPNVEIHEKPANPTRSISAEFIFHSKPAGAAFECKLDAGAFETCLSDHDAPFVYPGPLADGSHTFQVRATNTQGTGPAKNYTWIVDTQAPTTTIKTSPANPSPGESVAFTYEASQLGSTFHCSLAGPGQADTFALCPTTGQTYAGLADGTYTFEVQATDKAGNQGSAVAYAWEVRNSLVTPPVTPPIVSVPPITAPKPPTALRCKKGFVKKKVKGKTRCVKKKKKAKRR